MAATLSKNERLHFRDDIQTLLKKGKWRDFGVLKVQYAASSCAEGCRIMVSVPKRNFKRAVVRNVLKRRIREAYRLNKEAFTGLGIDILFFYKSREILSFDEIAKEVVAISETLKGLQ